MRKNCFKVFLLFISLVLLTGCGKVDKDKLVNSFVNKVESSKAYTLEGKMEIYSGEDTFSYNLTVSYMDDDFFKVDMVNTLTNHEQLILRNNDEVYVVTPSLNKSYKFVSEWPYNSSQSYILNTLVKDINENEVSFNEEEDGYSLRTSVNYPSHNDLSYEKLFFDKDMNLTQVMVYDSEDIVSIKVDFTSIDYKANLSEKDFDVDSITDENCCSTGTESESTSSLDDIIYPLYIPSNTYLKEKEMVNTETGERAILTFNGDKNFVLIEETSTVSNEFEVIPVYGDPLMVSDTIGAMGSNSLTWTKDDVNYYLTSNDLTTAEIISIADSLGNNTQSVYLEK